MIGRYEYPTGEVVVDDGSGWMTRLQAKNEPVTLLLSEADRGRPGRFGRIHDPGARVTPKAGKMPAVRLVAQSPSKPVTLLANG
jgi:hypothetical protein